MGKMGMNAQDVSVTLGRAAHGFNFAHSVEVPATAETFA
jgi:hypothetical protein